MPYSAADVRARPRILRMLLGAPSKAGKTTTAVLSSPQPVFVFNTDGKGALDPVVALGGDFTAEDVTSRASFQQALLYVKNHINDFETIIFDNITGYASIVEAEVRVDVGRDDPRVIYPEYTRRLMKDVSELLNLPRHVILIAHLEPGDNETPGGFGHILGVSGSAKTKIPMVIQDWVWLHVEVSGEKVERQFLLAPSGNWTKGVRSIQGATRMVANVQEFIDIMEAGGVQAALQRKKAAAAKTAPKPAPPNGQPVVKR